MSHCHCHHNKRCDPCHCKIKKAGLKEIEGSKYRIVVDESEQKVEIFNCKTGCTVDLIDLPGDFCDSWNGGVGDMGARAFAANSTCLTAENAASLALKYKTFIPTLPNQLLSCNESLTVTPDMIYLTTQNTNTFAVIFGDTSGNYVVAIRRKDGKIMWKREVSSYTGLAGDYTRGAPVVQGDYAWFLASNVFNFVQSTMDPDNPSVDLGFRFSGVVPFKGTNRRNASAVCINRHTGDLVWVKQYGKVASTWNDPDNFLQFGFGCTVIPDFDMNGDGTTIPLLIAGTNYVGQYFWNGILLNQRGPTFVSAGIQRRLRSYINQGSLLFINGFTGEVIKETALGPRNLVAGEVIQTSGGIFDPFIPGHASVQVRENIVVSPLVAGATFNYDISGGNWTCVTFNKDAAILGISEFKDTVPAFMNGLAAFDNTGAPITLLTGQTVAANPTYHEVNVRVNILWVAGQEGQTFTVPAGANPALQFSVADLVGLRISKQLFPGHTLSANDAYELRYAGPSTWAAPVAVNYNSNGSAVEVYLATGQAHKTPYDECLFFDSDYSTEVPAGSNFNSRQQLISDAVQTGVVANIRAAEAQMVSLLKQQIAIAETSISPRGKMSLFDSIVAFNLRPGALGQIIWHYKTAGFDAWQFPQQPSTAPNNGAGRSLAIPNGFTELRHFWEQPSGLDGDMGQRACLVKATGKKDKVVWASKQGVAGVIELSNVVAGPTTYTEKFFRYLGPASTLGGANYGSAVDDKRLYTSQRNISGDRNTPIPNSTNYYVPYAYYPRVNDTIPAPSPAVVWVPGDMYLSATDLETGQIVWESLLAPGYNAPSSKRGCGVSCSPGIVFASASNDSLNLFDSATGVLLKQLPGEAGNSWAGIADNEVYAWIGRSFGGTSTQYLRVFSLPKSVLRSCQK